MVALPLPCSHESTSLPVGCFRAGRTSVLTKKDVSSELLFRRMGTLIPIKTGTPGLAFHDSRLRELPLLALRVVSLPRSK